MTASSPTCRSLPSTLEKTARELSASGVEFNEAELPRSFREQADQAVPEHERAS
jgi:hypothetical protein